MIVRWTQRAIKDLKRTTREDRKKIESAVDNFAEDGSGDVRHLVDSNPHDIGCESARGV
jgi:mRNA-degrading endonuclease RelE of RelBE toxin-antitoxin system